MDVITLSLSKKYAKALADALGKDIDDLDIDLDALGEDVVIVNADGDIASKLIINALRQHIWDSEEKALVCEDGTVTLTNSKKYPFNDSKQTIALTKTQKNQKYVIIAQITASTGSAGDIVVSDKAVNGFKMAFTGGAKNATVKYYVIGGFIQ